MKKLPVYIFTCSFNSTFYRLHSKTRSTSPNIFKSLIILFFFLSVAVNIRAQVAGPPNIIVILADDMGFSDLGCYGGEIETPNLNTLAQQGVRFTQFYNAARCWPTRASILTGYYPQQVNLDGKQDDFPKWGNLLPHHLKQAGYKSYHSGKWHIHNVKKITGQGGFDRSYYTKSHNNHFAAENHFLNDKKLPPVNEGNGYYSTTAITNYALGFLKDHQEKYRKSPFFLYVAYIAPHFPLQAPENDIQKYKDRYLKGWEHLKRERYNKQKNLGFNLGENSPFEYRVTAPWSWPEKWLKDSIPGELRMAKLWYQLTEKEKNLHSTKMAIHAAMVDRIDQEVGRILKQLETMGQKENTLILFLSDNGASSEQIIRGEGHHKNVPLGSGGSYLCLGPGFSTACNTPFRRHKYWTHEGGTATPLIAYWPSGIKDKDGFRHSMGHVVDFLPTFCEIAGIDPIMEKNNYQAPELPGKSLVNVFRDDEKIHDELYFSHAGNNALILNNWKAVFSTSTDGRWQLYDMDTDRTELHNLADEFYNFGDPSWKKEKHAILEKMKVRWEELDSLYQHQGKIGLTEK